MATDLASALFCIPTKKEHQKPVVLREMGNRARFWTCPWGCVGGWGPGHFVDISVAPLSVTSRE